MRSKIAIVLALLGLLVLGAGIGQRTVWLPPATLTAATPTDVAPAPLTLVGPDLLKTRDGQFTMTIKADGPIQVAVGRERDIVGWIGNAAYTRIDGANGDFSALNTESKSGEQSVPNPSGSDMWVSEDKGTGEMSYTWQSPGHGDWALLLSSDGKASAPTNISITVDNQTGTPWAVPLMILGSALLALAALLFFLSPRKPKTGTAVAGRRSAARPADPATGALEVAKIVAARQATGDGSDRPSTISDINRAKREDEAQAGSNAAETAENAAESVERRVDDATSALPAVLSGGSAHAEPHAKESDTDKPDTDKKDHDDDSDAGTGSASDAASREEKNTDKDDGGKRFRLLPAGIFGTAGKRGLKARWGAVLAAVLVAGTFSPAVADDSSTPAPQPSSTSTATASPEATDQPTSSAAAAVTAGFPNLLDSQVQRIASAIATVVASGDNAKNAKELEPRVGGMALAIRTGNYKIRSAVAEQPPSEPVSATQLLTRVVTTTETWPRSAMLVTKGEKNQLPQLLSLVQASPRENYKLMSATPLLPGQTFPTVDKEGSAIVSNDDAAGLKMSPDAAVAALSDYLGNPDSKFKSSFSDSVYPPSVFDLMKKMAADAKDADFAFSHKADKDSVKAMRTSDGGVMVTVSYTFGIDATSKSNATLNVSDDAAVFTGGKETTKGFNLSYGEPLVMYIPAQSTDKITILSATRELIGGSFK